MKRIAVIDTGTNSTRLLVAEAANGSVRDIVRQAVITRLGEGVDSGGRLAAGARRRVGECVAAYAAIIGELGAERALIIATSSVRDAADGEQFIAMLARRFAFDYRVLDGGEEARMSFTGAIINTDESVTAALFDIGGGSTEVVVGRSQEISFAVSLNLGCVRIRERFLKSDPVSGAQLRDATAYIDAVLKEKLDRSRLSAVEEALAVAGTVTTLAAIDLGMEIYDRELVHGHILGADRIDVLLDMLVEMNLAERIQLPSMEPGRADVITAGVLILSRLMRYTGIDEFRVSERDILDGAALAMSEGRL